MTDIKLKSLCKRLSAAGQDGVPLDAFSDADMKLLAGVHARGKIRLISGPDNEPHVMLTNLDSLRVYRP